MRIKDMTGIEIADEFRHAGAEYREQLLAELEPHEISDMRRFLSFEEELLIAPF